MKHDEVIQNRLQKGKFKEVRSKFLSYIYFWGISFCKFNIVKFTLYHIHKPLLINKIYFNVPFYKDIIVQK